MAIQTSPLQRPLAVMMRRTLRTISPDTTLLAAAKLMRDAKVGALLVHEAGHYSGIVSESDLVRKGMAESCPTQETLVRAVMSSPLLSIEITSRPTRRVRRWQSMGFGIWRYPRTDRSSGSFPSAISYTTSKTGAACDRAGARGSIGSSSYPVSCFCMNVVNRSAHTPQWFLLVTAPATGAVVMALEILGSRLLAPVFGNSLFVWGALIGVILAAMSSGYAFGGWLSDRYSGAHVLAGLLLFSGAWTFLIAWLGQLVLFKVAGLVEDPRWGPCLAAALLLGPPAFGLSGVLPALLRLAVSDLEYFGRHTGRMIALSTVGSLAGTWGTAFFFLSWIGSQALVAWLGAIQVGLGLWWLISSTTVRPLMIGVTLIMRWRPGCRCIVANPDVEGAGLSGR